MAQQTSTRRQQSVVSICEADLRAYAAGELDASRRAVVEGFLACNPDLAAEVMQTMHHRERGGAARHQSRIARRLCVALACLSCAVAGWAVAEGLDDDGPFRDLSSTPEYVDDAIMSQRVAHVRGSMSSQIEAPRLDSAEIERATRIRIPALPENWRLLDAQVYPSEEGLSVSVLMEPVPGKKMNLFAVRANTSVTNVPTVALEKGEYAAYWESDGAAYVLTGNAPPDEILDRAAELSRPSDVVRQGPGVIHAY